VARQRRGGRALKLLVLGGTKFLGRAVVEAAHERSHEVTLFNRGLTDPALFAEAEHLRGDRDGDLSALAGRRWDAVVDASGYVPRVVRASAEQLATSVSHYVFVSSISVYEAPLEPGFDETAPVKELADRQSEDVQRDYGALKAACERVVREVFPSAHANVRAGLIVGPHDPTGRFTYWPERVARGREVLAPGNPGRHVQLVDVRDLGAWIVRLAEDQASGTFNATGPEPPLTMGDLLETCVQVTGSGARLVWMDDDFLLAEGAGPWMELPLWLPEQDAAILQADVSHAVAAGLRFRPVEETVRDTLAWTQAGGGTSELASGVMIGEAGMRPEREAELLSAWKDAA
jgi:nucleoside-diphosphate-sugar epimerase